MNTKLDDFTDEMIQQFVAELMMSRNEHEALVEERDPPAEYIPSPRADNEMQDGSTERDDDAEVDR
jgi:hypothetical protein